MRWRTGLTVLLAVAYPLLAHLGAVLHSAPLSCAAVLVLLSVIFSTALWQGRLLAWLSWAALVGATVWLAVYGHARLPQVAVPVLIDAFVAWLFACTLFRPSEPLIATIIRSIDGEEMLALPGVRAYARGLTTLWAVVMGVLAAIAATLALLLQPDGVLALFAVTTPWPVSDTQWSWFANVANYLVVAGLFVLELAWRRIALPQAPRRSLREFGLRMAVLWPQLMRQGGAPAASAPHV